MNVLEARRRLLGAGVYKKTVTGNPAVAQGSLARMYPGIEMQGWTEQKSTTGAQLFDEKLAPTYTTNGITVEWLESEKCFLFNGTSTAVIATESYINLPATKGNNYTAQTVYISGSVTAPEGKVSGAFFGASDEENTSNNWLFASFVNQLNSNTAICNYDYITAFWFYIEANITFNNYKVRVMLNKGSTALPWEPYTGGAPSPSPDYPQEIVSAGTQNQETGKWEYEITIANAQTDADKNQTVTLTSDRPLTKWDKLEKRNGQWGWVYKSKRFTSNDMIGFSDIWMPSMVWSIKNKEDYVVRNKDFYCEYFKVVRASNAAGSGFSINMNDYPEIQTAVDMANFVNSKEGSELPVTVCAETIQETFVPLSASEQESMNALHTNRPTTVLSNDADCEMTLTYKTKKSLWGGV